MTFVPKGGTMTMLTPLRGRLAAGVGALAVAGITLVAAGCGSSSSSSETQAASSAASISTAPPPTPTECASKGGTLRILSAGDVDHIDPGQAYYSFSYEITRPTQRNLLNEKPGTVELQPDLAAGMPQVTKDGKTVTVKLRQGVRFSPPVNREVTSADVKYAVERGFATSVANGYAAAYFGVIQGAPKTPPRFPQPISGIETPDDSTIVFHLTRPEAVFVTALSMPLTAPVPAEYAKPFDDQAVSSYGLHQVATGPYMIKNNAAGSINGIGYKPGQLIDLVRNPNWDASTDYRLGCADEIRFQEGYQDPTVLTKSILSGAADANGDVPPPAAQLKSILSNATQRKQLYFTPTGGARYIALNTRKPPFDNPNVRKAVAYVLDRNALRLTRGGAVDGSIATHFIDPSFGDNGFEQAGGTSFDPFPSPNFSGDVAKATELMRQAGYADGMYSGPQVTMVADNVSPARTRPRWSRPTWPRSGSRRRSSRSRTRRCTRSTATCRRTSRTSARTSAGCRTSTSRRPSSTCPSTARTSSRPTTRTGRF
jgi:peptide/nickel transport system substrate-binding protein